MLRVSFSPVPECVEADCWNRAFSTPPRHQERGYYYCCYCCCSFFSSFPLYLIAACFLKTDYHYTTIFQQSSEGRLSLHNDNSKKLTSTLGPKFYCQLAPLMWRAFWGRTAISGRLDKTTDQGASDPHSPVAVGACFWSFSENLHAALDLQVGGAAKKRTKTKPTKQTTNNK